MGITVTSIEASMSKLPNVLVHGSFEKSLMFFIIIIITALAATFIVHAFLKGWVVPLSA